MATNAKWLAAVGLTVLALLVTGCMLLPGRFASDLDVRRDGTFTFHYAGEIVLAPLADPSASGGRKGSAAKAFVPAPCEDEAGRTRDCSRNEVDSQRQDWEAAQGANGADSDAANRKSIQALLGGIDPADPRAAQEFADRLSRQDGWNSVVPKGKGVFQVDYTARGRLDHDFSFPQIERLPLIIPFVSVIRRKDGSLRIEAPAFSPGTANPAIPGLASPPSGGAPVVLDGTFALTTDGAVLANNTDEGPVATANGQRLSWQVNARTREAPTALVRLRN